MPEPEMWVRLGIFLLAFDLIALVAKLVIDHLFESSATDQVDVEMEAISGKWKYVLGIAVPSFLLAMIGIVTAVLSGQGVSPTPAAWVAAIFLALFVLIACIVIPLELWHQRQTRHMSERRSSGKSR